MGDPASTHGLKALAFDYLEELEIQGRSAITAERYGAYIDTFLGWLAAHIGRGVDELRPADITEEGLRAYRLFLSRRRDARSGRPIGPATRNLYQIALRNFLRYCARQRRLTVADPDTTLQLAKERDVEIRRLDREEVERMLVAVDLTKPTGIRDRAIIEALFGSAMRVSELAAMTRRQIDLRRREVEVIGKGGRSRLVLLTQDAADWVGRYLEHRQDDHPALFVGSQGDEVRPLGVRRIQQIVEQAAARAGLPFRVSPHWLRHSRLTALARFGSVQAAQRVAGHSSLQTTSRYLHVTDSQLRSVFDEAERADRDGG